jgi:mono/diheme cytochrome c family protein
MTPLLLLLAPAAGPLDLEPDDLRPGLVGEYRSLAEPKATANRIDPKPAFTLGRSSPHQRIPPGPFEVTWTGVLSVRDPGPLAFSAIVGGEVRVTIDDVTVLDGRGATDTARVAGKNTLTREPGYYPLTIRYRSLADAPARLQLWWAGPSFAAEVIPAWRLGHVTTELSPAAKQDLLAARGRTLAGKLGCARCHASAFPAVIDPPPGLALADAGKRLNRAWLLDWLGDPAKVRIDAHMPALFADDRAGFVERWLLANQLAGDRKPEPVPGDHRAGRLAFLSLGCAACHLVPDIPRTEQPVLNRTPLAGLGDRLSAADLATFLGNPHGRYPDGRMPRLPVTPDQARDIAAYLLLWSKPTEHPAPEPPSPSSPQRAVRRVTPVSATHGHRTCRSSRTKAVSPAGRGHGSR